MRAFAPIAACVVALLAGCDKTPPSGRPGRFDVNIESPDQVRNALDNAVASDRAIVFVHVDWAPMGHHRELFRKFADEYLRTHQDKPVNFHYIDFTSVSRDYAPLCALDGWDKLQSQSQAHLMGGNGELAWIKNRTLVCVESIGFRNPKALIAKTEALFDD